MIVIQRVPSPGEIRRPTASLAGPMPLGERSIHDRDVRRIERVFLGKEAAPNQGNIDGSEVIAVRDGDGRSRSPARLRQSAGLRS